MQESRLANDLLGHKLSGRWHWVAMGVGALWLSVVHGISLSRLPRYEQVFDFRKGEFNPDKFVRCQGWQPSPAGLAATAGKEAELVLAVSRVRFQDLFLNLEPTPEGHGKLKVLMLLPPGAKPATGNVPKAEPRASPWKLTFGRPWENFSASSLVTEHEPVNLARLWPQRGQFLLFIWPEEGAEGPLLQSFSLSRTVTPFAKLLLPAFYPVLLLALLHLTLAFTRFSPLKVLACGVAALTALAAVLPLELAEAMPELSVSFAFLAALQALSGRGNPVPITPALVALITFLGASQRWDWLNQMRFEPPVSDAVHFRNLANQMSWFYDTREREPLFIFFIKMSMAVLGNGDAPVRAYSWVFSVLVIPVMYHVARGLFGQVSGIVAAALIASNSVWGWHSAWGLRVEIFTLGLLLLTWAMFTPRPPSLKWHVVWLGLASAAITLVRISSLWFCLLGAAYAIYRRGWQTKAFAAAAALTLLLVAPYWVNCAIVFGDPSIMEKLTVKFYRNQEFKDQPGFPTSKEIEKDSFAGPNVSAFDYFFKMHTLRELVRRSFRQTVETFTGLFAWEKICDGNSLLYWWAVASYLLLAFSRYRMMLVWMLMLLGPLAWFFGGGSSPEWRLLFHLSAFVYLSMAHGLAMTFEKFSGHSATNNTN